MVWADDEWSGRVIQIVRERGLRLLTVGEHGETFVSLGREPTQLGQALEIETGARNEVVMLPLIGAYQAANALTAAGLVLATGGEPARIVDALGAACSRCAAGSNARRSRQRRAGLCRLRAYPRRARRGDRRAAAACRRAG